MRFTRHAKNRARRWGAGEERLRTGLGRL